MKNREFVMLASELSEHHNLSQWLMSEKLDGMRALWIPQTRGIAKKEFAWANHIGDERYINPPIATGLWSRYGNVIHAPSWFLDQLPLIPLDGELWISRGKHQLLMSIVKDLNPSVMWDQVKFMILDAPTHDAIFTIGKINNPNYKKEFTLLDKAKYDKGKNHDLTQNNYFELRYNVLEKLCKDSLNNYVKLHEQIKLPFLPEQAKKLAMEKLLEISEAGGEGLILKASYAPWEPVRSKLMIKLKPARDAEAEVIGYVFGTKRLEGYLGSLRVKWWNGILQQFKTFDLSGMTDNERLIKKVGIPGEVTYENISDVFPLGTKVTFLYRELSNDGIPKEARYYRRTVDV